MSRSLRVLGIDPGLTRCGIGVVDVSPTRTASLVHVGVVRSAPTDPIEKRLAAIAAGIREVLHAHDPHVVAVERVFAQNNRHSVMGTAQASGIALLLAAEHGIPAATHTPSEVKAAVTGYGAADKLQVQTMVARVLRLDALPQPADAADALAIALCHAWRGGAASPSDDSALTPAQRAWRDAEKRRTPPTRVARTHVRTAP
ncbi:MULTISPECIES: crossover junction endodeoxyribonuclease RuvC [unclassified Microbacterium]|uniref:crossover junction endodeoxyribonuclease RuvC n=1 Tax=unclassified Microbacterium TaxID=2609290 RepID=UPI0006FC995E|nr:MULTISPECIES: crossover junction endodeoxyribonuclease RuvC [unclassified Microbacterium]MBD8205272.1 crossover junction endodeoxyribonuclease RuvC [Microbacterium sp. CFBP 8801]MBD8218085.1 crossover junction endodeoxyribonuclease RuvC [Microbacterium sp. CFBP 13617]MBD8477465.1 crossover junction endodeoxyribonuclease RuvC [Microbacterium sp. CFBP 8794]MBD8509673.1 crossover junction endodeoxyribonuclease RuvC [Microbacterium sp. CFBP 8790]AOX44609.1 crossover junction endodeoxyribonuclea